MSAKVRKGEKEFFSSTFYAEKATFSLVPKRTDVHISDRYIVDDKLVGEKCTIME